MRSSPTTPLPPDVRLMNAATSALAVVLLGLILMAAWAWLSRQPIFALRTIQVEGDVGHVSAASLRANAVSRLSGNFLSMNLREGRKVFESVPWVRHAVLQRVWPGVLRVTLEEHHAAAYWEIKAEGADADSDADVDTQLVNDHGETFQANLGDVEDQGLPTLSGPDGSAPQVLRMWQLLQPRLKLLDDDIDRLDLSGRGSWRATLEKGAVIEIGRGSETEVLARFDRFVRTLPQVTSRYSAPLVSADLRHTDGYAVKLQGITTSSDKALKPGVSRQAPKGGQENSGTAQRFLPDKTRNH